MADLTVQKISLSGVDASFVAADAAGDTFTNDGRTTFHIKNGSAAGITVTIDSASPCSYGYDHDVAVSVPAGGSIQVGPFRPDRFNKVGDKVHVSYSDVTSVTVATTNI
jgi:hypothetical protein